MAGAQTAPVQPRRALVTKLNKDTGAQIWERYYSIDQLKSSEMILLQMLFMKFFVPTECFILGI